MWCSRRRLTVTGAEPPKYRGRGPMRQDINTLTPGDRLGKKPDTPAKAPALRAVSFFKTEADHPLLTERQREELARIGTRLRLPARTLIYREAVASDAVFAIAEGVVKTYRDMPSGKS